jgi:hypothetical protein
VLYLLSTSCVLTLAFSTLLFSLEYLRLRLSIKRRGGLHQRTRWFLGVCLPADVPVAPCSSCIYFTLPQPLELILDSVVIQIFIYNLYAFISRYVLWYLDDSAVYMRDLILAHIWLLDLCSYKSGVTTCYQEGYVKPGRSWYIWSASHSDLGKSYWSKQGSLGWSPKSIGEPTIG